MPRPTDDAVWVCRATYGLCTEHSVIDGHDRCGWHAPADRDREDLEELRALSDAATPGEWRSYFTIHADPFVLAGPSYPQDQVAAVSTSPDDYGRADAIFVAACVNYVRSRLASPTTGEPEPGGER